MKQVLFCLIYLFFTFNLNSQNKFKKGYFIDNNNNLISCFIKDIDWKNNPSKFKYKIDGEVLNASINDVKEFGVEGNFKYLRKKIDFDISTDVSANLDKNVEPIFKQKNVFLEVLIDGKASLFYYENNNIKRYFYKDDKSKISPLVYKRYLSENGYSILKNETYKKSLSVLFSDCEFLKLKDFLNLEYNYKSLYDLFVSYNNCGDSEANYKSYANKKKIDFNLRFKLGTSFSTINFSDRQLNATYDFGNSTSLRVALEAEAVLPFNNNRWSLFLELAKNTKIEISKTFDNIGENDIIYDSFEIPLGFRHYIYINDLTKINLDLGVTWDIISDMKYIRPLGNDTVTSSANFFIGAGIQYKSFGLETRYNFSKRGFDDKAVDTVRSKFNSLSVLVTYKLF